MLGRERRSGEPDTGRTKGGASGGAVDRRRDARSDGPLDRDRRSCRRELAATLRREPAERPDRRLAGAAGSRIADIELVNTSFSACTIRNNPRVRLVSGHGATLINGPAASTTGAIHTLAGLGFLRTEASASNYCGHPYAKPVTLEFVLPGTLGVVVAIPVSASDASGVPPCNGAPGSAGHISMHAWHR